MPPASEIIDGQPPASEDDLCALPAPVSRYLRNAIPEGQPPIRAARMQQCGLLRGDPRRQRWMNFEAREVISPLSKCFSWDAKVRVLPLLHMQLRDAYAGGAGSGQVRLMSVLKIAAAMDEPELNAASLHRYLAEAVWYPTALLPSAGVQWRGLDSHSAIARLSDARVTVELEFRFNANDEVASIYTPGRWRRVGKGYALTPWEGRFSDYRRQQGLLVPAHGEVGWHVGGRLEIVWKGDITTIEYEFADAGAQRQALR